MCVKRNYYTLNASSAQDKIFYGKYRPAPTTKNSYLHGQSLTDIITQTRIIMATHTYTRELEHLILETLLPTYYRYCREHDIVPLEIHPELLKQIKTKQVLPKLLQPKP